MHEKGGLLDNSVIGFVDGSTQQTSRPSKRAAARRKFSTTDVQRYAYCGGKTGAHGLVLQSLLQVDAMAVVHVELLSMHDSTVLRRSGLIPQLREMNDLLAAAQTPILRAHANVCIYGDPAYANLDVVKRKNKGLKTTEERVLDKSMQPSRANVEDYFGNMTMTFPYFNDAVRHSLVFFVVVVCDWLIVFALFVGR